jgi:hypothetical protein
VIGSRFGRRSKDVEVAVQENELVVKGRREAERKTEGAHYFAREPRGAFERRFAAGDVDASKGDRAFNHRLRDPSGTGEADAGEGERRSRGRRRRLRLKPGRTPAA